MQHAWEGKADKSCEPGYRPEQVGVTKRGSIRQIFDSAYLTQFALLISPACGEAGGMLLFVPTMTNNLITPLRPPLCALLLAITSSVSAQEPQLPPINVTATKFEEDSKLAPAYVTVITRDQIQSSNAQTVNEAIIRIGGVASRQSLSNGNEQTLDLMGFGDTAASNTVIVVDGVPLREGDSSEIILSSIPIESIDRIEIQRGSASVLYGEGATAGVINIITKATATKFEKSDKANLYVGAGSFGTYESRVNAQHVSNGLQLDFFGMDRKSDGFRQHSENNNQSGSFSLKIANDSLRAGVSLKQENSFAMTPGSITFSEFKENRQAAQTSSIQNNTYLSTNVEKYSAFVEKDIADFILRLDAYRRNRDYDSVAVLFAAPNRMNFQGQNDYLSLSARHSSSVALGRNQSVFGIEHSDWRQDRFFPDSTISTHDYLQSNSLSYFLKNDLDVSSINTRFSFGYRTETNDRSQLQVLNNALTSQNISKSGWELGASKAIDSDLNVYAKISESYRFANIDELATAPFIGGRTIELLPQTSNDKEAGWKYNFAPGSFFGSRIYVSDLENEIIYDAVNFQNINLSPTRRKGIDFNLSFPFSNSVNLYSSFSVRDAKFVSGSNAGNQIPMSAKELLTIRLNWAIAEGHRLGVDTQWTSKQFVAGDFSNENTVPSYTTTDLRYLYKKDAAEFSLVVKNVFDRSYFSYATRATDDFVTFYNAVYPDAGRALWASVRLRF